MSRLEQLKSMLAEDPSDSFLKFAIGKEYEKSGEVQKSIELYESIVSEEPSYIGVYYHLAHLYSEQEEVEKAFATYDSGIQIAKKSSDFHAMSELINARKNLEMEAL